MFIGGGSGQGIIFETLGIGGPGGISGNLQVAGPSFIKPVSTTTSQAKHSFAWQQRLPTKITLRLVHQFFKQFSGLLFYEIGPWSKARVSY